jgi:hypothetical protein
MHRCPTLLSVVVSAALAALLALLAGCAGTSSSGPLPPLPAPGPAPGLAAGPGLPTPAGIAPRHASTLVNILGGLDFDPQHNQLVADDGQGHARFEPAWEAGSSSPATLAYALYELVPDLANDAPLLHLAWYDPAPEPGTCWVALANFAANRWEWYAWTKGQDIPLDLQGRHVDQQGRVLALVLLTGAAPCELGRVRIGANQPPVAQAPVVNRQIQPTPFTVSFAADGCTDPDGVILSYAFDFDGDGALDETYDHPLGVCQAQQDGAFRCFVTVTDDDGETATAVCGWDTDFASYLAADMALYSATFFDCCSDGGTGYYACGYAKPDSNQTQEALLARFDDRGALVWARTLNIGASDEFQCIVPAPGGGVFAAGITYNGGVDGYTILCRYGADGTLAWQRRWGSPDSFRYVRLACDAANNRLYLSTTLSVMGQSYNAALLRWGFDGSLLWARTWGGANIEEGRGVALDDQRNPLLCAMTNHMADVGYDVAVLRFTRLGVQTAKVQLSTGNSEEPYFLASDGAGQLAVGGSLQGNGGSGEGAFIIQLGMDLAPVGSYYFGGPSGNEERFTAAAYAGGKLWAVGMKRDAQGFNDGLICRLETAGSGSGGWMNGPEGQHNELSGLTPLADGSFALAGRTPLQVFDWQPAPLVFSAPAVTSATPPLDALDSMLPAQLTLGQDLPLAPADNGSGDAAQLLRFWEPADII